MTAPGASANLQYSDLENEQLDEGCVETSWWISIGAMGNHILNG